MIASKVFWLMACVLSGLVFAYLDGPRPTLAQGVEYKWQTPPSAAPIVDLLVAPSYGRGETIYVLYILTETDLYRSTDAGASWSQLAAWPEEIEEFGEVTLRAGAVAETSFPDSSASSRPLVPPAMVGGIEREGRGAAESGAYDQGHILWIADSSGAVWTVDAAVADWTPLAPTATGAPSNGLQPALNGPLPPSAHLSAAELTISAQQEIVADGILRFMGLSPDGDRLLVAQNFSDLCFYDIVTLQELDCAHVNESIKRIDHERITWSPDQHRLALTEDSPYAFQESDIWILDIDTGESTNLTDDGVTGSITDGDEVDYMPLWSLDGQEIYFVRTIPGDDPSTDLYAMPADGGDPRKVLVLADSSFALHGTMHWSQDGSGLYFSRFLSEFSDPTNGMWRYDTLTHSLRQLLGPDEEGRIPTVRAVNTVSGKALIQYLERPDRYATLSPTTYALLDLATEELSVLLPAVEQDEFLPSVTGATLSPDGSKVLFSYSDSQENFHLIVRDVDAGEDNVLMSDTEALGVSATRGKELTWANNDTVMIVAVNEGRLVKLAAE